MVVLKREFHRHERGMGDEDWYHLAQDTESGRVFVYHEWSHRAGKGYKSGEKNIELVAFLARQDTARDKLLRLIGTLVEDGTGA
jgi:hypothetical protein